METTRLWALIEGWLDVQMFRPSQAQLAKEIGVARNAVSKWKFGEARPTPENLRALSRVTGIPFRDLRTAVVEDLGYIDTQERDGDDGNAAPIESYGLAARRGKKDNPDAGLGDEGVDAPGEWDGA